MIRRPPRSTQSRSSAASDVYKRQTVFDGDKLQCIVAFVDNVTYTSLLKNSCKLVGKSLIKNF